VPAPDDFLTPNAPTWCPGCGNFAMWRALRNAYSELDIPFEKLAMVWGIGCHGNGADFTRCQGFHALHGRALPVATGLHLSNPELTVVVEMGDGDAFGIGIGHFLHSCRRNLDMTSITHDNQVYGLTTGQASPTTERGAHTPSTPTGVLERPVNTIGLAIAEGATFVARGYADDVPHLTELMKAAITHRGFSVLDVFQPCVTWNKLNTHAWFRDRVYKLEDEGWDPSDRAAAMKLSMETFDELTCTPEQCRLPIGVIYEETGRPTYADGLAHVTGPLWKSAVAPRDISKAIAEQG
jgi:2-oxoglutarate ferredoxin oxidoreductase subunit beta